MNTSLLTELVRLVDGSYAPQDISLTNWLTIRRQGGDRYDHRVCPSVCATHLPRCQPGAAENLVVSDGKLLHTADKNTVYGFFALGQVFKCDVRVALQLFDTPSAAELQSGANHKLIWFRRAEKLLSKKARWTLGKDILGAYEPN